jgi:hypothetical protein
VCSFFEKIEYRIAQFLQNILQKFLQRNKTLPALRSFDAPPKRDDAFVVVLVQTKEHHLIFFIHDKATSVQSGFCHERGARLFVYNSKIFLPKNAR